MASSSINQTQSQTTPTPFLAPLPAGGSSSGSNTPTHFRSRSPAIKPLAIPSPETALGNLGINLGNLNIGLRSLNNFARSRALGPNAPQVTSPHSFSANIPGLPVKRVIFPAMVTVSLRLPFAKNVWKFSADTRMGGENLILLLSIAYALWKVTSVGEGWAVLEISTLIFISIIYLIWTQLSYFSLPKKSTVSSLRAQSRARRQRTISPRHGSRERKRSVPPLAGFGGPRKDDFGYVWMTVPKNYRNSADDGVLTALLLTPLIALACLYTSTQAFSAFPTTPNWAIEPPLSLPHQHLTNPYGPLILSRRNLIQHSTLCSFILLVNLTASRLIEVWHRAKVETPEGERGSVPRSELKRSKLVAVFAVFLTLGVLLLKAGFDAFHVPIWKELYYYEMAISSLCYQLTLYIAIRLAHRSFTLGELGLVAFGGTILTLEAINLTLARMWPVTTPYIKTFRLPRPLLILQLALITGSILVGFLLSPLLYLSRHIAQRPLRKLRFPAEKPRHMRMLAFGFYSLSFLIVGGLIGMWTRWCLRRRDPWLWVLWWILDKDRKASRLGLLAYWTVVVCVSVVGWGRQLARKRRYRQKTALVPVPGFADVGEGISVGSGTTVAPDVASGTAAVPNPTSASPVSPNALGLSFPNLTSNLPNLPNMPTLPNGNDILDAADKRLPTLGLNGRRKFFHGLVVVMFIPAIAIDPAFTHLSFSVAFALFTFMEYIRYFALYPFGAAVHVFMTEFLDGKDSGTAILSHFYLLTGCAGSLWLEGPSKMLDFTGVLVLGIGDAVASIVGRRMGRRRWTHSSSKSLEGTIAFATSIIFSAWLLRFCGLTASPGNAMSQTDMVKYGVAVCIGAMLEALSVQNDNLTLPLYLWSLLVIMDVR